MLAVAWKAVEAGVGSLPERGKRAVVPLGPSLAACRIWSSSTLCGGQRVTAMGRAHFALKERPVPRAWRGREALFRPPPQPTSKRRKWRLLR
ncbi:hypothetical protein HPB47_020099, partial [Ixodes persulcatus]